MEKNIYNKIKTMDELAEIIKDLKKKGKKVIHCHGVFDLLHPGHIKHFEVARTKGNLLIVTVTRNEHVNRGPGRPLFNHFLRAESIAALDCVDYVAVNEWPTAVEAIKKLRPDLYVKGGDYSARKDDVTGNIYREEKAARSVGGDIYFTDEISFSSTAIINSYFTPYSKEVKDFFVRFKRRYSSKDVINGIKRTENTKILVIGDIIIDEYHYCAGVGKSQKDNIIATKFINEEVFAGGVLASANHIAGFCKRVTLLSCIGTKNNYSRFIKTHLKHNIRTVFYSRDDSPTVVKRRFLDPSFLRKLFEICYLEETHVLQKQLEDKICRYLNANLKKFDMVLVMDFGHGLITPAMVDILSKKSKYLALNVQTNSANFGYNLITKYPHADYICIDEPEMRLACHDRISDLKPLITKVSKKMKCDNIIITRGHKSSLAYSKKKGFSEIPIFSTQIVDRIGAGDAYASVTSPCVFKGAPMDMAGVIGNAVGAMKVLIVGNRASVEPGPLYKYITTLLK